MILIGNGQVPFAVAGAQAGDNGSARAGNRVIATSESTPMAIAASGGQSSSARNATLRTSAVKAVLATAATANTTLDPQEMPRVSFATQGTAQSATDVPAAYVRAPVPPLQQFAGIPTELTQEIARLHGEALEREEALSNAPVNNDTGNAGKSSGTGDDDRSLQAGTAEAAGGNRLGAQVKDLRKLFDTAPPAIDLQR
ncbi:hypothetical protein [Tropicimonas sp.]|uniref:hypothetical protein n=1 Tax=Tropicimonas sp. TaxID=2067044 RepID=UPI003A865EE5